MDIYKLAWKSKFRLQQIKSMFKLGYYNARKKLHLEGDEGFYYHMQRDLMRYTIHADVEEEYLIAHGLLPDPEPEPEALKPESEPGLIRELEMFDLLLSAATHENVTYIATEVKEYEDHIFLKISKVDPHGDITEYQITQPHKAGEQYTAFSIDNVHLQFDGEACKLQIITNEA